jgi:hypothetical protein
MARRGAMLRCFEDREIDLELAFLSDARALRQGF